MPNWCSNYITISGEGVKKIKFLLEGIENKDDCSPGVFMTLVGRDKTIPMEEYESGGWWQSNIDYWGCKWDVSYNEAQIDYDDDNTSMTMSISTAWSPPSNFVQRLGELFKVEIEMSYEEGGCDFCGKSTYHPDRGFEDECYTYDEGRYYFEPDSFWDSVRDDIEYMVEDAEATFDSVKERYSFITKESELKEIEDMFNEIKLEFNGE